MTQGKRIAAWTASYAGTNGQAIVTQQMIDHVLVSFGEPQEYVYQTDGNLMDVVSWTSAVWRLWWGILNRRIDTLYLVGSRSNAGFIRDIPALAAALAGVRVVAHAHGSDITDLLTSRIVSALARTFYRNCTLVVPSGHLIGALHRVGLREIYVCENFSIGPQKGLLELERSDGNSFVVFWNSNVMASKGAFDVFEAVGNLRASGVEIELWVIGSVLEDQEMSKFDAEKALDRFIHDGTITYFGCVTPIAASKMVRSCDVVALPSRYSSELQPLAIIQAMCAGRAIIVSDTPALRNTLGDYPADFLEANSVDAIADILRRLCEEKRADAAKFNKLHVAHSQRAQVRFSRDRFDTDMIKILTGTAGLHVANVEL